MTVTCGESNVIILQLRPRSNKISNFPTQYPLFPLQILKRQSLAKVCVVHECRTVFETTRNITGYWTNPLLKIEVGQHPTPSPTLGQ